MNPLRLRWLGPALTLLRRHWLLAALLAAGLTLRILALVAYHPALLYVDSLKYLYGLYPGSEPLGYTGILRLILLAGGVGAVALVQHLIGLATAVVLYVILLRRGAARWLAALAAAPLLLDAYQIQIEQMIMPEALFAAMIVAALAVLLWRPTVTMPFAVAAGLVLGASAVVKQVGLELFVPAVVYLLVNSRDSRRALVMSGALIAAFMLPVLAYCSVSYVRTGHFWLARQQSLTGRLVAAADCATLRLPAAVRPLCPTLSEQANGPDWLEKSAQSPLFRTPEAPGTRGRLISELKSAVIRQQPLRVLAAIAGDSLRLFAPSRVASQSVTPISRWQFQTSYPTFPPWVTVSKSGVIVVGLQSRPGAPFGYHPLKSAYGGNAQVDPPVAAFLRSYQLGGGYTPGPLLALCAIAGIAGSVAALVRRRRGTAEGSATVAVLLFTVTGAMLLLGPDVYQFTWRYQLSALFTLPAAGALALTALIARRRTGQSPGGGPARAVSASAGSGETDSDGLEDVSGRPGVSSHAGGEASEK